jgi:hypothetical protein
MTHQGGNLAQSLTYHQENANIGEHMEALGQKYMGIRPQGHADEMFKDTSVSPRADTRLPSATS